MAGGTCTISYGGTTIDLGTVTSFGRSYSKSVAVTPLVSLPMEQAFPLESASQLTVNISFSRVGDNTSWYNSLTQAMNRWQCRTDGFTLRYTPDPDNPFIPPTTVNGYIKSLSRTYSSDANQLVTGTLEFHVGTMYCSTDIQPYGTDGRAQSEFAIFIYDKYGNPQCILGGDDDQGVNCVDSYTLCGGLEEPFEYISINIPKKKLARVCPTLTEDLGIVAGKTVLNLYAVGTCEMTVTKCRLSNNTYRITAYSNAEKIRGYTLPNTYSYTPLYWIRYILTSGQFGVTFTEGTTLIMDCDTSVSQSVRFNAGTGVWYVLQVCAMFLGARVFFAEGKAYVVDYRMASSSAISDVGTIDLYGGSEYLEMVAGSVTLGDEGADTIVNKQTVRYSEVDDEGNETVFSADFLDEASIEVFGEQSGGTLSLTGMYVVGTYAGPSISEDEDGNPVYGSESSPVTSLALSADSILNGTAYVLVGSDVSLVGDEDSNGSDHYVNMVTAVTDGYGLSVVSHENEDGEDLGAVTGTLTTAGTITVTVVRETSDGITPGSGTYTITIVALEEASSGDTSIEVTDGYTLARLWAENYISYRSEPQQSISFTLKEMSMYNGVPYWRSFYSPCSRATAILDEVDEVTVTNDSTVDPSRSPVYQRLTLSSFERSYPEGNTTYTWGVMQNIDLSTSTSKIVGTIDNS